jgi:adenylate cyclase
MTLQPQLIRKLKILGIICIFTIVVGLLFQWVSDGIVGSAGAIVGLFLGLGFGVLELFILKKLNLYLRAFPFYLTAIVKVILYTLIVFIVSNFLGLIYGYVEGKSLEEFYVSLFTKGRLAQILVSLVMYTVIILFLQISRLLGDGVLLKILYGKYHKPVEEERIFMFLDLKSSTTIAEKIGHEKFYSLLNTFFHEITEPVLATKAEIYQYVGDEIVFNWTTENGLKDANCLKIFFMIKKRIADREEYYLDEFGVVPGFKAGVHYGRVIIGQIGDIKREIVFNGDVLNTTARIQDLCNKYQQELLVSRRLLSLLKLPQEYAQEYLGKFQLRGKEEEIHLYGINEKKN